jgi:hypothetical protein
MEGTLLPRPAHSPELAPSDYHFFGPVKDAMHGSHFADEKELKQNFVICSKFEVGHFAALAYSVLLKVGKSGLKHQDFVEK